MSVKDERITLDSDNDGDSKELKVYVDIIERLFCWEYGKKRLFYDDGQWYDRRHGRNISLDELTKEFDDILQYLYELDNNFIEKVESNLEIHSMLANLAQEVAQLKREANELKASKANREDIEKFAETASNAELLAKKATENDDDMAELGRIFLRILKREADE